MKRSLFVLLSLLIVYGAKAQHADSSFVPPKFRLALSFGVAAMNPDQINDHIATSDEALGSSAQSIKSMPELAAALTIRPNQDTKILILRGGYLWTERDYSFAVPETDTSSTPVGKVKGQITEKYSAYPFSVGVGLSTLASDFQVELDFIYALGYITESGSFTTAGGMTSYSNTLSSPAVRIPYCGADNRSADTCYKRAARNRLPRAESLKTLRMKSMHNPQTLSFQ